MDRNPELYFKMKKQQLIELIKANKTGEAIKFAQTKIAPKCMPVGSGSVSTAH